MALNPKDPQQPGGSTTRQATQALRWDNHVCLPFGRGRKKGFSELERHKTAGFNVAAINIGYADRSWNDHVDYAWELTEWVDEHDESFLVARTAADIQFAIDTDRLGIILDVEGANLLEGNIDRVETLYDLGVRWMSLTYNLTNDLAGGCSPDSIDTGLTDFGRDVVREMNRVGMIVCCSHTGPISARQVIEHSDQPTIFSHSNCSQVFPHWRNITDDAARSCAEKGGIVCVNGVGPFLGEPPYTQLTGRMLDHIEHLARIVGTRHIGLGLDYVYDQKELTEIVARKPSLFGGAENAPPVFAFVAPEEISGIEIGLRVRRFSELDIERIVGGNLARVGAAVWR